MDTTLSLIKSTDMLSHKMVAVLIFKIPTQIIKSSLVNIS